MGELKVTTWMLLICAVIALLLLITGPLGYKYSLFPLGQAMGSVVVAFLLADAVLIFGLVMFYRSAGGEVDAERSAIVAAIVISLLPVITISPNIYKAFTVPPIHDISTDTVDPPVFDRIADIRRYMPNPLTYGTENMPAEKLARFQEESYPNIKPLVLDISVNAALDRAAAAFTEIGIELIGRNDDLGLVEGTDETFWFGFKDDVVVRVRPGSGGTIVDVRSISRVGQSDLGVNAKRVRAVIAAIKNQ